MIHNKRLAILARMDDSGLGHQTRDLVRLLKPDKVIAIDFGFYNGFKQHPEWYADYDTKYIEGFLQDSDVQQILQEVDIVLTAETFYNNRFIDMATDVGVVTLNQINYEFFEPLMNRSLLLPTKILMPSYWHLADLQSMTIPGKVIYLPPPIFLDDFAQIRSENMARTGKRRFLHVAGKMAAHDRAGTKDLLAALNHVDVDFDLVIKVQSGELLQTSDPRVTLDYSFPEDEKELYRGFDAMIMPRRYAGLNLPMNEALASGLPVVMTDIEPQNRVLPSYWLVNAYRQSSFFARTNIDVYGCDIQRLGEKIRDMALMDDKQLNSQKSEAFIIARREFDHNQIHTEFTGLIEKLGI